MVESPERCTRLPVRIAAKSVKFRSSLIQADPYIAENAGPRDERKEEDTRKLI